MITVQSNTFFNMLTSSYDNISIKISGSSDETIPLDESTDMITISNVYAYSGSLSEGVVINEGEDYLLDLNVLSASYANL